MRIEFNPTEDQALVVLSKRNLLAGLHKLEMPGSARTITSGDDRLILKFETDEEHYADRGPAGRMHPQTEEFITTPRCGPWEGDKCLKCGRIDIHL